MKRVWELSTIACATWFALLTPGVSAVVVPVTPPANSASASVFGINDSNAVVGSYVGKDDGVEHGFFGPLNGAYSTFDGGDGGTQPRAINNAGYIVGFSNSQLGSTDTTPIFERAPHGRIRTITRDGQQIFGAGFGINNSNNEFVGEVWEFGALGFSGRRGHWTADIDPAPYQYFLTTGINSSKTIVAYGRSNDVNGVVLSGHTLTVVRFPSRKAVGTQLWGINDAGQATGQWYDANENPHSFVVDIASQTFTDIKVKGAAMVQAWGINSSGAVAVTTDIGPFIWCATAAACPGAGAKVDAPIHVAQPFAKVELGAKQ